MSSWAGRLGWRLNLGLLAATLLTTTVAGGGFLAAEDDPLGGALQGPLLLLSDPVRLLAVGVPYSLSVVAILGAHEMGHYLACLWYGVRATPPFFIPSPLWLGTFGAVIRIREQVPSRRALFDIGIAGPLAGFAVTLPVLVAGLVTARPAMPDGTAPEQVFASPPLLALLAPLLVDPYPSSQGVRLNPYLLAAWVGMFATAINLLPSGQLDGGHICYAISRRLHRIMSRVTLATLVVLLVYATVVFASPVWLVWVVLLGLMGPRHPPLGDEGDPLRAGRIALAILAGVVLLLCFTAVPVYTIG